MWYNSDMDLFDYGKKKNLSAPLYDRMRPRKLEEFLGQKHILEKDMLLLRAIKTDKLGSCIFFGPPGCGKTTLAGIIAESTKGEFVKLNAVASGVSDAKKVIEEARERQKMQNKRTYLLLDECHRWNKAQSDCVLSAMEDGSIIFIGSTTENPYISMTRAIVSRCRVFELKPLLETDLKEGLLRAIADKENGYGNLNLTVTEDAINHIVFSAAGDLRNVFNSLELAVLSTPPNENNSIIIDKAVAEQSVQRKSISIDESIFYDMLSAFCKSLRGSDSNAALYWAFRLLESGCDPLVMFRRMIAHSSEDIGMADSSVLPFVVSAMTAYEKIGMPEGGLPLAHAIIYMCTAEKSNSVLTAKLRATDAVRETGASYVPLHLRNTNFSSLDKSDIGYKYPHDYGGYTEQQYLPDEIKDRVFYEPSQNGKEAAICEFLNKIKSKN